MLTKVTSSSLTSSSSLLIDLDLGSISLLPPLITSLLRSHSFLTAFWHIWKNRNNNLFNHLYGRPSFRNAYSEVVEFFHLSKHSSSAPRIYISLCWTPPPNSHYKLNTDGACKGNSGKKDIRGVIRDSSGNWVEGFYQSFHHTTNTHIELLALLRGLTLVYGQNWFSIEINTDSQLIIVMLQHGHLLYNSILDACRSLMQRMSHPPVRHSYRGQNRVVDALAKEGVNSNQFADHIFLDAPSPLL